MRPGAPCERGSRCQNRRGTADAAVGSGRTAVRRQLIRLGCGGVYPILWWPSMQPLAADSSIRQVTVGTLGGRIPT